MSVTCVHLIDVCFVSPQLSHRHGNVMHSRRSWLRGRGPETCRCSTRSWALTRWSGVQCQRATTCWSAGRISYRKGWGYTGAASSVPVLWAGESRQLFTWALWTGSINIIPNRLHVRIQTSLFYLRHISNTWFIKWLLVIFSKHSK